MDTVHRHRKPVVVSVSVVSGADAVYNKFAQVMDLGGVPTFLTAGQAMSCLNTFIRYRLVRERNLYGEWLKEESRMSDRAANPFERFYSTAARGMTRSVIRELLKFTNRPGLISFAGGLPHPGTFPSREHGPDLRRAAGEAAQLRPAVRDHGGHRRPCASCWPPSCASRGWSCGRTSWSSPPPRSSRWTWWARSC